MIRAPQWSRGAKCGWGSGTMTTAVHGMSAMSAQQELLFPFDGQESEAHRDDE